MRASNHVRLSDLVVLETVTRPLAVSATQWTASPGFSSMNSTMILGTVRRRALEPLSFGAARTQMLVPSNVRGGIGTRLIIGSLNVAEIGCNVRPDIGATFPALVTRGFPHLSCA